MPSTAQLMTLSTLYPTGLALLGDTEFLRRVKAGQTAMAVNMDAIKTRDSEAATLIREISVALADYHVECFHLEASLEVYVKGIAEKEATQILNALLATHAPMFSQSKMEFEYDESLECVDRYIMLFNHNLTPFSV